MIESIIEEQATEWDYQSKCNRCGGSDEQYGGMVNMVDGRYGLCANCAEDMGVIRN